MIGAFYQPQAVLSDTAALKSPPAREYASGLAEIIKHALIFDAPHLESLNVMSASSMPAMTKRWPGSLHTRAGSRRMWSGAMSGRLGIRALLNHGPHLWSRHRDRDGLWGLDAR